jgi:hypothetical protein
MHSGHNKQLTETTTANTQFILFGHSASAFAKAVALAKDVYFCFANT